NAILENVSLVSSYAGQVIQTQLSRDVPENHPGELEFFFNEMGQNQNFRVAYFLDSSGKILFASNGKNMGNTLSNSAPDCQPCHRLPVQERPPASLVVTSGSGERVFRSMFAIENGPACVACHSQNGKPLGLLLADTPLVPLEGALTSAFREGVLWSAGMLLVTILIVNLVLNRLVIQRLVHLLDALSQFGQGNFNLRLPSQSPDEIGQLADAFNKMGQRIEDNAFKTQELSEQVQQRSSERGELLKRVIGAQENERRRVAREIHDDLGQALGGISFQLEATRHLFQSDPPRARQQLDQVQRLVSETTESMYDIILALRPSELDDLGLVSAIRSQAESVFANSDIHFEMEVSRFNSRLPAEVETAVYRTLQEALSNIVRYARASRVTITCTYQKGIFEAEITDNGKGFSLDEIKFTQASPRGLGLLGMQERISQCGGQLIIDTRLGSGTRILLRIPIESETNHE
ncbi:MAG: sensor histidine kinase, partial [Anaerolineales bacterium]|nr:sensor histidine kinase [Anaerolineales bacterium]